MEQRKRKARRRTVDGVGMTPDLDKLRATLTVLTEDELGRVIELGESEVVIGHDEGAHAQMEDESVSGRHARFTCMHDAWVVEDLGSMNGTFVDGNPVTTPVQLTDGARVRFGDTITRFSLKNTRELAASRRLYESLGRDPLTGCHSRHYLDEHLPLEFSYACRSGAALSILFVHVDDLEKIGAEHGKTASDQVLRDVARHLRDHVRMEDIIARHGAEELLLVVRGNDGAAAIAMAERLREDVETLTVTHAGKPLRATVTVGVATMEAAGAHERVEELVARADSAVYMGSRAGGNRVEVG